jgi:hypothetical protein
MFFPFVKVFGPHNPRFNADLTQADGVLTRCCATAGIDLAEGGNFAPQQRGCAMTNDRPSQDPPAISGDPILLNVLATAQRFAAWYAEYLSAGIPPAPGAIAEAEAKLRADELARHLQHAVFDLMAAVHEMNRHCAGTPASHEAAPDRVVALARAAVH